MARIINVRALTYKLGSDAVVTNLKVKKTVS